MKKCKCGNDIKKGQKFCVKCGKKYGGLLTKWWVWLIGIVIVLGAIGGQEDTTTASSNNVETKNAEETIKPTEEVKKEETIKVSVDDLVNLYNENEVKADKTYKGKLIEITGKVDDIGVILSSTFVTLQTSDEYAISRPQCTFDKQEEIDKIADLSKGDTVTIIGRVGGKSLNVAVDDCVFK